MQERADEIGVFDRLICQVVLKPSGEAFEVLIALGQDSGLHHGLPDVMEVAGGR
jgi:hypothetical protein